MRSFLNNQSIDWTAGKSISAAPALCGNVGCIRSALLVAMFSSATKFCRLWSPLKPSEEGVFVRYAVIRIQLITINFKSFLSERFVTLFIYLFFSRILFQFGWFIRDDFSMHQMACSSHFFRLFGSLSTHDISPFFSPQISTAGLFSFICFTLDSTVPKE